MHQLTRGAAPACLSNYQPGTHTWCNITPLDRVAIRAELETMQGRRCAYCECDLDQHGQHIEHFRQRGRFIPGTFQWDNLFWSCERDNSCGKHKDKQTYNPPDLIKPDSENPEHFFLFADNGSIAIRPTLTPSEKRRAEETLRIFNLDEAFGPLRKMRDIAVSGYLGEMKELQELSDSGLRAHVLNYIAANFAYIRDLPFCTAIKHTLAPA